MMGRMKQRLTQDWMYYYREDDEGMFCFWGMKSCMELEEF